MTIGKSVFFPLVMVVLFSGCRQHLPPRIPAHSPGEPSRTEAQVASEQTHRPLLLPADSVSDIYLGLHSRASVLEFYRAMEHRPVWFANEMRTSAGDSLKDLVKQTRYFGLLPQNYHDAALSLFQDSGSRDGALRHDVLLTDAFLTLARDLRSGRTQRQQASLDSLHRLLLAEVVDGGNPGTALRSQEPLEPAYQSLKTALRHLLDTASPLDQELFFRGVTLDSSALHRRVQTIEVNLERWRWQWEREPLGTRYLFINIPAFVARVVEKDSVIFESRVIVGTPQTPTPRLSSTIERFIIYPYWHVPRRIAVEELLPDIQKDSNYIRRNNFDVLDMKGNLQDPDSIDWRSYNRINFPFTLRQREGVDNSLGVLKFYFDNRFGVFLHDTNARRLFNKERRALSHGCIRMERAVDFAHYLITGRVGEVSPVVQKYLKQKIKHTVDAPDPMPIHVRYFTADVTGRGLEVYPDVYKKDAVVIRQLYGDGGGAGQARRD